MINKDLSYYIHCFTHLKRDAKNGGAPHKPILLLSVIKLFENGLYTNNQIFVLPELVASFKANWSRLVVTNHFPIFAMPFYHLSSEPFWKLMPNAGCEKWIESKSSMRSFGNLTTAVNYALIDKELSDLLLIPENRDILKITLLDKYFSDTKSNFGTNGNDDLPSETILHDNSENYKQKIIELKNQVDENAFQEEVFIRGGLFKREIPKIYNNTCAISGLRLTAITTNVSMVDACHIVPFSEEYDDTLTNGIALCPNVLLIDEAHVIFKEKKYQDILEKILREIRSKGVSVVLLSQGIEEFNQPTFDFSSMCEISFLLNVKDKTNAKAINKFLGFSDKDGTKAYRSLEKIQKGQAISNIKEFPKGELFEIKQFYRSK